ncbi:nucleoside diphosphate kinase 6-like [Lycorma delicatula]|uniref:nucleoside diphosphate kinase 6-like n=1 Tax=Lycorma delicatula TaxID=130591 RepID=UPI003F51A90E
MSFEITLALIKPHVLKVPRAVQAIRNVILENGFYVVQSKQATMCKNEIENFYKEHEGKFFYNRLVTFMMSGPIEAYILTRLDAIDMWRKLMGPTKVFHAQYSAPGSIRGKFGLTDTRNATHGSDSLKSSVREISVIFPEFEVCKWMELDEKYFKQGSHVFRQIWQSKSPCFPSSSDF